MCCISIPAIPRLAPEAGADADAVDWALSDVEEDIREPLLNLSRILRNMELFLRTLGS